jgi:hypothetical protein
MDAHVSLIEISSMKSPASRAQLSQIVRRSLDQALAGVTKLTPEVLAIPGMSGKKYRFFINTLIEQLQAPKYLEIGSWAGSTLCSAVFGNSADAVAIDNWSQFDGPSDQFFRNLAQCKGAARVSFLEKDFRDVDYLSLGSGFGPFNVYFYDGPHSEEEQYYGIMAAQSALEPCYVQIVDDWNWPDSRNGTLKAIAELGLQFEFMAEIRTTLDDRVSTDSDWHNGYLISVLTRPS